MIRNPVYFGSTTRSRCVSSLLVGVGRRSSFAFDWLSNPLAATITYSYRDRAEATAHLAPPTATMSAKGEKAPRPVEKKLKGPQQSDSHLYLGSRNEPVLPQVGMAIGDVGGKAISLWGKMVALQSLKSCWMAPGSNVQQNVTLLCTCSSQYLAHKANEEKKRVEKKSKLTESGADRGEKFCRFGVMLFSFLIPTIPLQTFRTLWS